MGSTLKALIDSDAGRHVPDGATSWRAILKGAIAYPGLLASILIRTQSLAYERGRPRIAALIRTINLIITGLDAAPGAEIGPGLLIPHPSGIVIGGRVSIGANVTILQHATLGVRQAHESGLHEYPTIEDDVIIGAGACVLGGVTVGRRASIGANAVVLSDVPRGAVFAGVPASEISTVGSLPNLPL